jgi:hypothetical protein
MLISDKALISTNNRNYKKFLNLGYDFEIGQKIEVSVDHLEKFSRAEVDCKCDKCGKLVRTKWNLYIRNVNNGYYSCSRKCSMDKFKNTCLNKYGSEFPIQNEVIKKKLEEYFYENYGCHPAKLEYFEKKKQKTNREKYGVCHQMQIKKNIHKIKNTNIEKWGVEWIFQSEEIKKKIKKTKLEKYADENYNNVEKAKITSLKRYGVDNNMKDPYLFSKNQKSRFNINQYKGLDYQSTYELDLIKFCEYKGINIEKGPSLEYLHDSKSHVYHSDFYLPYYNLICEVKSSYIYNKEILINESKRNYSIKSGYNFLFVIDKNYIELEKIISKNDNTFI